MTGFFPECFKFDGLQCLGPFCVWNICQTGMTLQYIRICPGDIFAKYRLMHPPKSDDVGSSFTSGVLIKLSLHRTWSLWTDNLWVLSRSPSTLYQSQPAKGCPLGKDPRVMFDVSKKTCSLLPRKPK